MARGHKGKGVLLHGVCDQKGRLLSLHVTPANGSERGEVIPLLDDITVPAAAVEEPPQPKVVKNLAGDKGYDSNPLRRKLRARKIRPEIPRRNRPGGKRPRGRPIKHTIRRFIIERAWAWLQRKFRRIVVRWERKAVYFEAFLQLALTWMWSQWILSNPSEEVSG